MTYEVKALRGEEGVISLFLEAADEQDAARQARHQGYAVLAVHNRNGAVLERLKASLRARGGGFPLILFTQELLALLQAGLGLVEALEALAEKETRRDNRDVLDGLKARLYEGQPLSAALQRYPAVFPALYVATVRASEKTGDLPESLARYVAYQNQLDVVRKKLVSASIYPVLLIVVGGLVTLFLMAYVVPRFSSIYESNADLPFLSSLLLRWGQWLEGHALLTAGLFGATLLGAGYAVSRPAVRQWAVSRLWQIPALGARMQIYQLARFYRTVGMLLRGGIPIVAALEMVSGLLQPSLRGRLQRAAGHIKEGQAISAAMETEGLTTPVALRMLRVGERTGRMGEMMERIAAFHDEEMARWVEWFTRLFEPLLMAFIGLVIGLIVVLMYLPVFELAGSIQ